MKIKEYLGKVIGEKEARAEEIRKQIDASEDVKEVRALGETLQRVLDELAEAKDQLDALDEEEAEVVAEEEEQVDEQTDETEGESEVETGSKRFNPIATYGAEKREKGVNDMDKTNSVEYRTAFMNYVTSGKPIPEEVRANANTLTSDVASVIPTMLIDRIVESMTHCGMILPLVTRTAFAGGVVVPTSSVKPVASWVAEGASSDRQKKTTGTITFSYYKLRCEISMSAEVGAMALSAFEATFVQNVVDAMTVAREKAILAGDGSGKPTGILNGTIPAGQIVTTTGTNGAVTYADLLAMEGKLPPQFDPYAVYFCTKSDFYTKILGMTDADGQPVARVNIGLDGRPERLLLGRPVIIHSYATEMGDNILGLYDFRDYIENTIYDLGIMRERDWETEDLKTKAVMSVDGKPVSLESLVVMQAGS